MGCGFHRSGECAAGIETITAADGSITVNSADPNNPTIAVGTVPAANVKHRFMLGEWRASNIPTGAATTVLTRATGQISHVGMTRAGRITRYAVTDVGGVAVAGAAIDIQVSVDNQATWASIGSIPIGTAAASIFSAAAAGTPAILAASNTALVDVRVVTPAGYTSVNLDPTIVLEYEET